MVWYDTISLSNLESDQYHHMNSTAWNPNCQQFDLEALITLAYWLQYLLEYHMCVLCMKSQFLIWIQGRKSDETWTRSQGPKGVMLTIELHSIAGKEQYLFYYNYNRGPFYATIYGFEGLLYTYTYH